MSNSMKDKADVAGSWLELVKKAFDFWPQALVLAASSWTLLQALPLWAHLVAGGIFVGVLIFIGGHIYNRRKYVPLATAAVKTYEKLEGTIYATAAERMTDAKTPDALTSYVSQLLSMHVEIYARHPPSTVLRKIPSSRVRRGVFGHGGTVLTSTDPKDHDLVHVSVLRSELKSAIRQLQAEGKSFESMMGVKQKLNLNWRQTIDAAMHTQK